MPPLLPRGKRRPRREDAEHRPGGLMEKLPGEAPQDPERHAGGAQQRGQHIAGHGLDFNAMGAVYGKNLRVSDGESFELEGFDAAN